MFEATLEYNELIMKLWKKGLGYRFADIQIVYIQDKIAWTRTGKKVPQKHDLWWEPPLEETRVQSELNHSVILVCAILQNLEVLKRWNIYRNIMIQSISISLRVSRDMRGNSKCLFGNPASLKWVAMKELSTVVRKIDTLEHIQTRIYV